MLEENPYSPQRTQRARREKHLKSALSRANEGGSEKRNWSLYILGVRCVLCGEIEIEMLGEIVKRAAAEAGFELAGVAAVRDFPELQYFSEWISAGNAGDMKYLEARNETGERNGQP